jgi:hypothetical protein
VLGFCSIYISTTVSASIGCFAAKNEGRACKLFFYLSCFSSKINNSATNIRERTQTKAVLHKALGFLQQHWRPLIGASKWRDKGGLKKVWSMLGSGSSDLVKALFVCVGLHLKSFQPIKVYIN